MVEVENFAAVYIVRTRGCPAAHFVFSRAGIIIIDISIEGPKRVAGGREDEI